MKLANTGFDMSSSAGLAGLSASLTSGLSAGLSGRGRAFAHITQYHPELTAFRRDLHAHPELGFEEVYTSGRVQQAMMLCGVDEVHTGMGKTGVVAIVRDARLRARWSHHHAGGCCALSGRNS